MTTATAKTTEPTATVNDYLKDENDSYILDIAGNKIPEFKEGDNVWDHFRQEVGVITNIGEPREKKDEEGNVFYDMRTIRVQFPSGFRFYTKTGLLHQDNAVRNLLHESEDSITIPRPEMPLVNEITRIISFLSFINKRLFEGLSDVAPEKVRFFTRKIGEAIKQLDNNTILAVIDGYRDLLAELEEKPITDADIEDEQLLPWYYVEADELNEYCNTSMNIQSQELTNLQLLVKENYGMESVIQWLMVNMGKKGLLDSLKRVVSKSYSDKKRAEAKARREEIKGNTEEPARVVKPSTDLKMTSPASTSTMAAAMHDAKKKAESKVEEPVEVVAEETVEADPIPTGDVTEAVEENVEYVEADPIPAGDEDTVYESSDEA